MILNNKQQYIAACKSYEIILQKWDVICTQKMHADILRNVSVKSLPV